MLTRNLIMFILVCLPRIDLHAKTTAEEPFRILHVMSYHKTWEWNIKQFQGFKDGLGDLDVEYRVVELDTKRESSVSIIENKANMARQMISDWQPDLLYTNDDNAQKYVAQYYVGTSLPIVFSAVNRDPSEYHFLGSPNVTGVMEYEHFVPTVNLLRKISGDIKRVAVIIDDDPTWRGVISRIRSNLKHIRNLEITDWILIRNLSEYKQTIEELQSKVDAIALLGVFNIKAENGQNVDYEEILKWTAENSQLPDFSFWESRVDRGTLCAVAVSGYEQGYMAGQMARRILKDGESPQSIRMVPSIKGEAMLSLPRARALGLELDVRLLLDNTVKKRFNWVE